MSFKKIIGKGWYKFLSETKFLLEQKWGWRQPLDKFAISKSILKKYLPENAVMIDCGAHIGADSVELARLFPNGTVHSFEPVPEVFRQLEKNTSGYTNIYSYKVALGNQENTAAMFISSGTSDASSSLLAPKSHIEDHPNVHFENQIDVKITTLDAWAKKNGINKVDFLWLDMQGFEYQMLKASNNILPTVKVIFTEVSLKETYHGCAIYNDFKHWLQQQHFEVEKEIIPDGADMGNVLFVRK